jgi:hypothetical protein
VHEVSRLDGGDTRTQDVVQVVTNVKEQIDQ